MEFANEDKVASVNTDAIFLNIWILVFLSLIFDLSTEIFNLFIKGFDQNHYEISF